MIKGNDLTLLNVTYKKPNRRIKNEDGSTGECFEVIYMDSNGVVHKSNEPAEVDIYFVKPEFRTYDYNKSWERMDVLEKRRVLYSNIMLEIAKEQKEEGEAFVQRCYEEYRKPREARDKKYSLEQLYRWVFAYGCDFQAEFYFLREWYEHHAEKSPKLTKAFLDIETDLMDYTLDLDNISGSAHSPVNCVTVILEESKESFTFILRPFKPSKITYSDPDEYKKRYSLYEQQLEHHNQLLNNMDTFVADLHESFDPVYGDIRYVIREYEHEIELIADVFRLINDRKPNFCLMWNMRFDIQYLLERIKVLLYEPASIMCHPDFNNPSCFFTLDKKTFQLEKQFDYFYCSSYTQYICQMRLYSSVRKSQQMLKSVSLNAIGNRELRDRKVEYPSETNMMYFPYTDWKRFIKYNIKDVLIQLGIERKTNDVMTYYSRSHSNLTPYNKIFRETHLLRNVREKFFNTQGLVQGNNINILRYEEDSLFYSTKTGDEEDEGSDESSYKGAIMADPIWNDNVGVEILGMRSNRIYANSADRDMEAFYPSIKIACNMDPETLLYKASLNNEEFISGEYKNRSLNILYQEKDKYGKTRNIDNIGELVNTFVAGNILTFCYNYLGAPSITELLRVVKRGIKK